MSQPWTVTIAGPERLDGEKPFTYLVNASSHEDATTKALVAKVVLEPELVRELAEMRLAMKRRNIFKRKLCREEESTGDPIRPSDWEAWEDMGSDIVDRLEHLLASLGIPATPQVPAAPRVSVAPDARSQRA